MIELQINHHFPAVVGFYNGEIVGKIDAREKEGDVVEKINKVVDDLKNFKPITINTIKTLRNKSVDATIKEWTEQGKPVLFHFDTDNGYKLNPFLEEMYDKVRGKVLFVRIQLLNSIFREFGV